MELTRVRRRSPLDIDAGVVDRALHQIDALPRQLDNGVSAVGVIGVCRAPVKAI